MKGKTNTRPEVLINAPLHFAPENELGVVYLFSHLAKNWRIKVDTIRAGFPDCIAYQKVGGREKAIRIEFEFKSRNFKTHKHKCKNCDWLVCWEHNWSNPPNNLHIVELRREFGLGFNVWLMPVREREYKDELRNGVKKVDWSVPAQANKGDLILFYFTAPDKSLEAIFVLQEKARYVKQPGWRATPDHMAELKKVTSLKSPLFLEDLRNDRVLKTSGFVRSAMIGRPRLTDYWPWLHRLIIARNPGTRQVLKRFAPENL